MAAIEAVGVGEKSHEDVVMDVDTLECRGHGVRSKLCGRVLAPNFRVGTASSALAYSKVSVVPLEGLRLGALLMRPR